MLTDCDTVGDRELYFFRTQLLNVMTGEMDFRIKDEITAETTMESGWLSIRGIC